MRFADLRFLLLAAIISPGALAFGAPLEAASLPKDLPAPSTSTNTTTQQEPAASGDTVSRLIIDTLRNEDPEAVPDLGDVPPPTTSDGGTPSSPSIAALQAFQAGDVDLCLSHLRDVVAKQPTLPPPKLILAGFYLKAGQRAQSRAILEELAAKPAKHPQLYISLADLAMVEGRLADAEAHLQLVEAQGVPAAWNETEQIWLRTAILGHQAAIAERRGNWNRASEVLTKWVQVAPNSPQLRHRWATALFNGGSPDEAFEQLDIAYRQSPELGLPEVAMAALYAGQREYDSADQWYARAAKRNFNDPAVPAAWAMALLHQNRADEAIEQLQRSETLGGSSPDAQVLRGIAARVQRDYGEAERHLSTALELLPGHEEGRYQLVMSLIEQSDPAKRERALQLAQQFAADMPHSSLMKAALGAAWQAAGDLPQAEQCLRQAAASPATRPETVYLLGKVLAANGNQSDARRVAVYMRHNYMDVPGIFVLRAAAADWVRELVAEGANGTP